MTLSTKQSPPSMDEWLREAKAEALAPQEGMYLVHNGVVRRTAKAMARLGDEAVAAVSGMDFSYDPEKVTAAVEETRKMKGIYHVRVWLNEGRLTVGEDIMYVLIGGDIRPNLIDALQYLVGRIKNECVSEVELRD